METLKTGGQLLNSLFILLFLIILFLPSMVAVSGRLQDGWKKVILILIQFQIIYKLKITFKPQKIKDKFCFAKKQFFLGNWNFKTN